MQLLVTRVDKPKSLATQPDRLAKALRDNHVIQIHQTRVVIIRSIHKQPTIGTIIKNHHPGIIQRPNNIQLFLVIMFVSQRVTRITN